MNPGEVSTWLGVVMGVVTLLGIYVSHAVTIARVQDASQRSSKELEGVDGKLEKMQDTINARREALARVEEILRAERSKLDEHVQLDAERFLAVGKAIDGLANKLQSVHSETEDKIDRLTVAVNELARTTRGRPLS